MPRNRPPVGRDEAQRLVALFDDAEGASVQQPMVIGAQEPYVPELRLSTVDPVL
jgi:hypothetical protein